MSAPQNRIAYFASVASGLREILTTPAVENASQLIGASLENRASNFLELARRVVFANPANPFHRMFKLAKCEYDDLAAMIGRDGLEPTLATLHRNGVYLTHAEFKLTSPIVRSGQVIAADAASFRNPLMKGGMIGFSGGSRSGGTLIQASTAARIYLQAYDRLLIAEFDLTSRHRVGLMPILPAIDAMVGLARCARVGCAFDRWFSPIAPSVDSTHYRWGTAALVAMSRMYGARIPFPVHLPPNDFSPVARWIAARRREGIASAVISFTSPAVRVAATAADLGLSIEGTLFLVGGETLTDAKRKVIESSGAEVFAQYYISEFGAIGIGCRHMTRGNCVHLFSDSLAVIQHRRTAPFSEVLVDSLLFTALQLHAPQVLINTEMDDAGVLDHSPNCGCRYAMFTTVIRDINSFGKLTGHGVTLVGTDILRILEHGLPARFGGSPIDYQLLERDGPDQAKLMLRVSRRVPLHSLEEVKNCFLGELRVHYGGQIASRLWRDADALEVVHEDPIATARGKILPLHLLRSGEAAGPSDES